MLRGNVRLRHTMIDYDKLKALFMYLTDLTEKKTTFKNFNGYLQGI